jgi:hypothetical protein
MWRRTGNLSNYLLVDTAYWDITSWTPKRVVAELRAACRRNVLTVDAETNQVFQVQTDVGGADLQACGTFGKLKVPRITTLEDCGHFGQGHSKENIERLDRVSKYPRARMRELFGSSPSQK